MRDSKFEYLKIFAMLMIIVHHLIAKNAFNTDIEIYGLSFSKLFYNLLVTMHLSLITCFSFVRLGSYVVKVIKLV